MKILSRENFPLYGIIWLHNLVYTFIEYNIIISIVITDILYVLLLLYVLNMVLLWHIYIHIIQLKLN